MNTAKVVVLTLVMGEEEASWKSCLALQFQLESTSRTSSSSLNGGTGTRGPRRRTTPRRSGIRKHVSKSLGDRVDNVTEAELLKEIERLAVERQSNLINTVPLMSAPRNEMKGFASLLPV
jgi:hypothetical protein